MNPEQQQRLALLASQPVELRCSLARYTSFAIGGPADALVRVVLWRELPPILRFLKEENIPWRIIGKGTNLLVRDTGFPGVILRLGGELATVVEEQGGDGSVILRIGGGASLSQTALRCAEQGLSGLQFACGIPGTVGGAVIMNAGAWGRDIAMVLNSISLTDGDGERRLPASEMDFVYRCCRGFTPFQGKAVVTGVELQLQRGERQAIVAECKLLLERRRAAQPSGCRSAGSFFKNPPGDSAGRLIEASGLKGLTVGGAMVSAQHGNFLVNTGEATAADVLRLMQTIQEKVRRDSGVRLEPEVHII